MLKGEIVMRRVETEKQLADIFTKPLDASHFATLRGEPSVRQPSGLFLGRACFSCTVIVFLFLFSFAIISYHIITLNSKLHFICRVVFGYAMFELCAKFCDCK